jgi:hypothetical protein
VPVAFTAGILRNLSVFIAMTCDGLDEVGLLQKMFTSDVEAMREWKDSLKNVADNPLTMAESIQAEQKRIMDELKGFRDEVWGEISKIKEEVFG